MKTTLLKHIIPYAAAVAIVLPMTAAAQVIPSDSIAQQQENKKNVFQKAIDYISSANTVDPGKKFDFTIVGGPYYSQSTNFGIGLLAAGLFQRGDSIEDYPPLGQVNVYGNFSVIGNVLVGIEGSNYFGYDTKLYYDLYFNSSPEKYWGIGYDSCSKDSNEVKYKQWLSQLNASLMFPVYDEVIFVGPVLQLNYIEARNRPDPALWRYQKARTFTDAIGFAAEFDTRDDLFNAYSGMYVRLDQLFAPKFTGNQYAFSMTEARVSNYFSVWKGGVLATNLHTRLTYGNTPWGMMSGLGGPRTMRGYWKNRFNDKCAADMTVELRQHLFQRFGIVAFCGIGEVFPKAKQIFRGHTLWDFGAGIRWEFKHRVNIRLDYGFGSGQSGIVFSVNEAF